ncbi:hypothetical protein BV22DRAFT_1034166 [Leucogyrophana mollusca]|uniref:Uncharacterized protein n=1 Tax=Leucogyrophana mollusca TaxID=85980 RepID=A0ACB8BKB6_9AGAM|nr:hypothetical protein BV22DRAFT_1034166 [Leucogyrophana mollusca]
MTAPSRFSNTSRDNSFKSSRRCHWAKLLHLQVGGAMIPWFCAMELGPSLVKVKCTCITDV